MQDTDEPSPPIGPVFERMVDRALDLPEVAAAIAAADPGPSREWLRAQALEAGDDLAAVAADEYDHYLTLRTTTAVRERTSDGDGSARDGLLPVLAVLVPSLGAAATGVFLLCGFGLRAFAVRPHIGDGLVMAGVIAAAVTAGAALGDLAWLLVARRRGRRGPGDHPADRDPEVRRARETWELAVLERGLVPFLLDRADPGPADLERVGGARADTEREHPGRPREQGGDEEGMDAGRVVGAEEGAQ
ncbi:hypothetical protein [Streptomyces sp. TP-A0356]|uniref:hypothetical protein n=1 Tax=Streptomyces sp. TP-A0356 TaxID=1359208 RepID=UPI0006E1A684|nr:hypothetical protein [Streptomyces sp. TP-A0356]